MSMENEASAAFLSQNEREAGQLLEGSPREVLAVIPGMSKSRGPSSEADDSGRADLNGYRFRSQLHFLDLTNNHKNEELQC
jgi:hypothetical protein